MSKSGVARISNISFDVIIVLCTSYASQKGFLEQIVSGVKKGGSVWYAFFEVLSITRIEPGCLKPEAI